MSDGITLNAGAGGSVVNTDDIAGVHTQIVKLAIGALDTAVLAIAGAGVVTTGTLRTTLASDDPAVVDLAAIEVLLTTLNTYVDGLEALIGTTNTNTGAATTALQIMDDWDNTASDGASVTGDVAHDGVDAGEPVKIGGYAKATAPTAVSLDGDRVNAWFDLAGRLAIHDGAGNLSIDDGGNSITVDWAGTAPPIGAGVEATALRVTLATDSTGVVSVDDNGASLTVDGTVTINAIPAGNNNIGDVDVASIAAGDNNIGNVDVVTLPALPAGTNNIGDVDVLTVAAGANLIGDVGIQPRTTNGLTTFMASGSDGSAILVATAQAVKASAGKLYGYYAYNPEAAVTFVHFYNVAAASVTVGTTNPLFTLAIPAASAANLMSDIGITFSNAGWSVAATTTAGGNTAPATGISLVAWYA